MKASSILLLLAASLIFLSCKKDDFNTDSPNELAGLLKITELDATDYAVEVYSNNGKFLLGHNRVFLRFREKISGTYLTDLQAT